MSNVSTIAVKDFFVIVNKSDEFSKKLRARVCLHHVQRFLESFFSIPLQGFWKKTTTKKQKKERKKNASTKKKRENTNEERRKYSIADKKTNRGSHLPTNEKINNYNSRLVKYVLAITTR